MGSRTWCQQGSWTGIGRALGAALLAAVACLCSAGVAQARDFNCDASAARLQLGGSATVEPITANRGATTCKTVKTQTAAQSGPVSGGVLLAETTATSSTSVDARGGLGQLSVSSAALAGIPIPTLDAIDALPSVPVTLPANPLLPPTIQVDIRPAVKALVAGIANGPLLELAGSVATAHARCNGSQPELTGETSVLGLKVLGQTLPTDAAVNQALTLYNGQTIDPGALDLSQVVLPPGFSFTDPVLGTILQTAVGGALKALPPITLPESLLQVSIKPSSQTNTGGGLTQQGLQIALSILGQNVLNAVIGEARVSVDSVKCTIQTPSGEVAPLTAIPNEALQCSSRRLALIDVVDRGTYVTLYGAADKRYAGKRITIRSRADGGRIVARPVVNKVGLFRARAPLPPARWRYTNNARYIAVYRNQKSLYLKLHRRMVFTSVRSSHGKVMLSGVVTQPWTKPPSTIIVRQRLTCRRQRIVARLRPDSNGRFHVTLKAPRNGDVGVYRATTLVGYPDGPDFRTYTLPSLVRFAR
ncbi:MAG: hypothetical protein QOC55_1634 [Thermoleophilaceae bacterium]|nr:hypothetical protein [Thermoleophilaceae bacterium]